MNPTARPSASRRDGHCPNRPANSAGTLGVPVWKRSPFAVHVAAGLENVVGADPNVLLGLEATFVSDVAERCYAPRAAAQALFAAVATGASHAKVRCQPARSRQR